MGRPNLLLLLTDQQRADALGASGNPVIRTPHLDRLAREGVIFSSAYTPSPVCVSARCSLIYGQYPHRTGCVDNSDPMPDDRPSLMDVLSEAGYRTHGIGKMHFTPDSQALRGFHSREHQEELRARVEDDDYLQFLQAHGFGHVYDPFGQRGEMYYIPQPAQMPAHLHGTQWVGDRAVDFLRRAEASQPFFLFVSFIHPHPPFSPPTPWNKLYRAALMPLPKSTLNDESLHTYANRYQNRYKYRDAGRDLNLLRTMKAYYYACVSFVDHQVGRIIATLEETDRLNDTIILFASDHGEFLGDYGCFGKRSMLDAAARVPLVARYRARFSPGRCCDTPVSLVDVFPTLLEAAGLTADGLSLDGVDLAEVAAGRYADRTIYSQYQRRALGLYMALDRRWKYFYSVPDRRHFLFDRIQDPQETRNRAGLVFCHEALEEMRRRLVGRLREDGYKEPLEGGSWRDYPQPRLPEDPDEGLLIQNAAWAVPYQYIPGYSD
ncbi:MAG: sulfatase-like hydrolase/transferase [Anaerolineae bacterium]|nr:sulfatase-like hydrolase/transferase [Anaerolineae bacterium]